MLTQDLSRILEPKTNKLIFNLCKSLYMLVFHLKILIHKQFDYSINLEMQKWSDLNGYLAMFKICRPKTVLAFFIDITHTHVVGPNK